MDAFDADVLIYAAVPGHPMGTRVRALFPDAPIAEDEPITRCGSVLLLPELLAKPLRDGANDEVAALAALLGRLALIPTDRPTAELATVLAASYGLRAADAIHLASAVGVGADRFVTNNQRDFPKSISEIDVTYPSDLPDPGAS